MRVAAVMLIVKNGLMLGVSRKENPSLFGLPGGKSEKFEIPMETAVREIKEETGITVHSCVPIFEQKEKAIYPGGEDFYTYAFYATNWEGFPRNSNEGVVEWLFKSELTKSPSQGGKGAFPEYNSRTLSAFNKLYPNIIIL